MKPKNLPNSLWWKYNYHFVLEHLLGYERFIKIYRGKHTKLIKEIELHLQGQNRDVLNSTLNESVKNDHTENSKDLSQPTLFRAMAANWQGTKKWNLDFFEKNYGDREIIISDNAGTVDRKNPQQFEKLKLREYIRQLRAGTKKYLKLSSLVQKEKSLQEDLDLRDLHSFMLPASFGKTFYMFMGGKGSITPLHNEFPCNVYVQISGQKKWILYPVEDRVFLNPRTERRPYFFSHLEPNNIKDPDYPLQKYARKLEVILNPGDVLWVPPFYWHYIENMTDSIGVAYKFANIPQAINSSKLFTALLFLSTQPSVFYSFFANRLKKEDYLVTPKSVNPE